MTAVLSVSVCVLAGFLLVVFVITSTNQAVNAKLAEEMLRGSIQHEGKAWLKVLQSADVTDYPKIFTPLKIFCNGVCIYMRLWGKFSTLNAKIETIRSTLASQQNPIPVVRFSHRDGTDHHALVEIGNSKCTYLFDLHHMDSLDLLTRGSGLR